MIVWQWNESRQGRQNDSIVPWDLFVIHPKEPALKRWAIILQMPKRASRARAELRAYPFMNDNAFYQRGCAASGTPRYTSAAL